MTKIEKDEFEGILNSLIYLKNETRSKELRLTNIAINISIESLYEDYYKNDASETELESFLRFVRHLNQLDVEEVETIIKKLAI